MYFTMHILTCNRVRKWCIKAILVFFVRDYNKTPAILISLRHTQQILFFEHFFSLNIFFLCPFFKHVVLVPQARSVLLACFFFTDISFFLCSVYNWTWSTFSFSHFNFDFNQFNIVQHDFPSIVSQQSDGLPVRLRVLQFCTESRIPENDWLRIGIMLHGEQAPYFFFLLNFNCVAYKSASFTWTRKCI